MEERLFKHIDIKISNTHIPNGEAENPFEEALRYEKAIEAVGGIDLQLLGIGVNGHIGFNEPSDYFEKETHLVDLSKATLNSNAKIF
jgi:6-phosphogluconolactonase/Glucosamine-6-phosphate isomerase/deaminase